MTRPFVLINVAVTADGKLDTVARRGSAISSARDKDRVDRLRAEADAVMVGGHTLLGDDPKLTVKSAARRAERVAHGQSENPAKVGITSRLNLHPDSQFLTTGPARIILFTTAQATPAQIAPLTARGVEVYALGETQVDLPAALAQLHALGIHRLMVEGGGTLNFELLRLGLVDEVQVYIAPLIFGGSHAPTLADGVGLPYAQAIPLKRHSVELEEAGGMIVRYRMEEHH